MSTKFFTNAGTNTLRGKLEGVFHHNPDIERFDALVGYLRASGYFALRPHFEKVPKVRILVGIDVEEIVADYHKRGLLFLLSPRPAKSGCCAPTSFRRTGARPQISVSPSGR